MNQKLLNFNNQKLIVDWISFKFQYLSSQQKTEIANYLFELGETNESK